MVSKCPQLYAWSMLKIRHTLLYDVNMTFINISYCVISYVILCDILLYHVMLCDIMLCLLFIAPPMSTNQPVFPLSLFLKAILHVRPRSLVLTPQSHLDSTSHYSRLRCLIYWGRSVEIDLATDFSGKFIYSNHIYIYTYKLLKMATELMSFPVKMVIFHSFLVNAYQWLPSFDCWIRSRQAFAMQRGRGQRKP